MNDMLYELALELDSHGIPVPLHIQAYLNEYGLILPNTNSENDNG